MDRLDRMPSNQSRVTELIERCISENDRRFNFLGIGHRTLFEVTSGCIYRNHSDADLKSILDDGSTETLIRITKPSHTSTGVIGSFYNHIQEISLILQIDIISRRGDDLVNDLARVIEPMFFDGIEGTIDGTNYYIPVERIEVTDAFQNSDIGASHAVISIYANYRDRLN